MMEEGTRQTSGAAVEGILPAVELAATGLEILAEVIIVAVILVATAGYVRRIVARQAEETTYKEYRTG